MARRNIIECDRCHHEVRNTTGVTKVTIHGDRSVGDQSKELCDTCKNSLDRFLAGEALEVPP